MHITIYRYLLYFLGNIILTQEHASVSYILFPATLFDAGFFEGGAYNLDTLYISCLAPSSLLLTYPRLIRDFNIFSHS